MGGADSIPCKAFAKFARPMSRIFHPIMVKSVLAANEPVQWRGGVMACFPKPGVHAVKCGQHRLIVLADAPGKALHKARRTRLARRQAWGSTPSHHHATG